MTDLTRRSSALLIFRLVLGFIFLMQGYGKVFTFGVSAVHDNFFASSFNETLPSWLTLFTAYYTSYVELIGGAFLIIGFKTDWTLYILGSVLVIVTFGHGLLEPIWELDHVMYRLILLGVILLSPNQWDRYSVDHLIKTRLQSKS